MSMKHGLAKTPTHIVWMGMNARCNRKKHLYYPNYGGRGIKICERWKDFSLFLTDMGVRPEGLSLDRIDSNGPYSKENCRWASRTEQNRNSSQNRNINFQGRTQCLAAWCAELNLKYTTVYMRLYSRMWSVERAFT